AGHPDVRVLDGGYAAWTSAGRPTTTDEAERQRGDFTVRPGSMPALAAARPPPTDEVGRQRGDFTVRPGSMPVLDAAGAAARAAAGALLDARAPIRFRGEQEPPAPIAGRIPGAKNLPIADTAGPDGRV